MTNKVDDDHVGNQCVCACFHNSCDVLTSRFSRSVLVFQGTSVTLAVCHYLQLVPDFIILVIF